MTHSRLKNHGRSLLEMMAGVPPQILGEIAATHETLVKNNLRPEELGSYARCIPREKGRLFQKDYSGISAHGLDSEAFVFMQIEWAASFSAVSRIKGTPETVSLFTHISEQTWPSLFTAVFPEPEALRRQPDAFGCFSEWFLEMMRANQAAGLFDYQIAHHGDDAFQINCHWCAWHEFFHAIHMEDACLPICAADDAFYPAYLRDTGIRYQRTMTLGRGEGCCDFRFERV